MRSQSEVTALVSAAARPFKVSFKKVDTISVNFKDKVVTVPLPPVIMSDEGADKYTAAVYDAVAAARWCDPAALSQNKKGELDDPLAYAVGMRRAVAKAMDTWAGDAHLYERQFSALKSEIGGVDWSGVDDKGKREIASKLVPLKALTDESKSIKALFSDGTLPPDVQALVDSVDYKSLPSGAKAAADEIRRALELPPPPPNGGSGGGEGDGEGEADKQEGKGKADGKGKGKSEKGEGDAEGEGPGEGEEGEGDGEPVDGESRKRPAPVIKGIDPPKFSDKGSAIGADGIGDYRCTPVDHVVILDLEEETRSQNYSLAPNVKTYASDYARYTQLDKIIQRVEESSIANAVRRMIQVKMRVRYENGKTSGKINRKAVYRLGMPQVGDGQYNCSVFRKKTVPKDTTKTAVMLLVDYSGSMRGGKTALTIEAVGALSKALTACHVKHEVTTFTEVDNPADDCRACLFIGRVRRFDSVVQPEKVMHNMSSLQHHMGQNGDADAVSWAYTELCKRKEPRKVLIVLSDGYPASSRPGDCGAALKTVVKNIEREKKVEVFGIGIEDDSVRHYYKNNVITRHAEELEGKLLALAGGLFDINET